MPADLDPVGHCRSDLHSVRREWHRVDSHFKLSTLNLHSAAVSGLYQVGALGGGFVGGYMTPVPHVAFLVREHQRRMKIPSCAQAE
jgi:hypothetical protein